MEPITLHIEYTLAEYMEASYAGSTKRQRRSMRPVAWLYVAAVIVAGWYIITGGSFSNSGGAPGIQWSSFLLHLWPYWVVILGLFVGIRIWRRRYFARVFRNRHAAQRPHDFVLDEHGIIVTEPLSRHEYLWQAFMRWQETKHLLLIFGTEVSAHFIPKRVFADESQLDAARQLLRTKIDLGNTAHQAFPVRPLPLSPSADTPATQG